MKAPDRPETGSAKGPAIEQDTTKSPRSWKEQAHTGLDAVMIQVRKNLGGLMFLDLNLDSILSSQLRVVSECVLALLFCYIPDLDSRVTRRSGNLKAGNSCTTIRSILANTVANALTNASIKDGLDKQAIL